MCVSFVFLALLEYALVNYAARADARYLLSFVIWFCNWLYYITINNRKAIDIMHYAFLTLKVWGLILDDYFFMRKGVWGTKILLNRFRFFTLFLGHLEGVHTFKPPLKQHPEVPHY